MTSVKNRFILPHKLWWNVLIFLAFISLPAIKVSGIDVSAFWVTADSVVWEEDMTLNSDGSISNTNVYKSAVYLSSINSIQGQYLVEQLTWLSYWVDCMFGGQTQAFQIATNVYAITGWSEGFGGYIITNFTPTKPSSIQDPPGAIAVSIFPTALVSAGACWQIDGGSWYANGATVTNVSVGSHVISFADVSGWITPTNLTVTIGSKLTTSVTVTYQKLHAIAQVSLLRVAKANVSEKDDIDDPIIPMADISTLEVGETLGKGVVADGVTPVIIQITGTPGDHYTIVPTCSDAIYSGSSLTGKFCVMKGNTWVTNNVLTIPTNDSETTGISYAYMQGVDWSDFTALTTTGQAHVSLEIYPTEDSSKSVETNLTVRPPPVVLVHGINSEASCWTGEFKSALSNAWPGEIWSFSYGTGAVDNKIDWPCTVDSLESLAKDVDAILASYVESSLKKDWAFTRYDVVGHSQGGVLLRMLCQTNNGLGRYTSSGTPVVSEQNFYRGRFRRVITIGSPHNGSLYGWWSQQWDSDNNKHGSFWLPMTILLNLVPYKSWHKFDPFSGEIREVNDGSYPVDSRIRFNCIKTSIYGGKAPYNEWELCYKSIGLCDIPSLKYTQTRGEIILPYGSDGVVDFVSEGGGKGTKTTVVSGYNISHCDPTWLYGVDQDSYDTGSPIIATNVAFLLSGKASLFGPFILPSALSESNHSKFLALLPGSRQSTTITKQTSLSTSGVMFSASLSGQTFSYKLTTNLPAIGNSIGWFVVGYSTNGVGTNGITMVVNTNDTTQVKITVDSSFVGDVVLSAQYTAAGNILVTAGPILVTSVSQGTLKSISIGSNDTNASIGDLNYLQIIGTYSSGATGSIFANGQATFSSFATNVATVDTNGVVKVIGAGKTTITAKYSGFSASKVISTAGPVITTSPASQKILVGKPVAFVVSVSGSSPFYYQWRKNGVALSDNKVISGSTNSFLSIAQVQITNAGNYDVIVSNCSGAVTSSVAVLTVLELVKPALIIDYPTTKQVFSNTATLTVSGQASDNAQITNVFYKLNSGSWTSASTTNCWTNWTANVTLAVSTNTLSAYSIDSSGNISQTTTVFCVYLPLSYITLRTHGPGTIAGLTNNQRLFIGRPYALTATASTGCNFSNWTGSVTSTSNKLTFTMVSNMVLQANFITNPFAYLGTSGSYQGLVLPTNGAVALTNSGAIQLTVTSKGTYSGSIQMAGTKYPLTGTFGLNGTATNTIALGKNNILTVVLYLDLVQQSSLTGRLGNADYSIPITGYRAGLFDKTNAGTYTLIIPGSDDGRQQPGGDGFATITLATDSTATLAGTLADNTTFSRIATVSKNGSYPVYASLYSNKGLIIGWLAFTNKTGADISGQLVWLNPAQKTTYYASGFTNEPVAAGSRYNATNTPVLAALTDIFWLDECNDTASITNGFALSTKNVATSTNKTLKITLTPKTGLFSGSISNAGFSTAPKTIQFKGALYQKTTNGYGFFLGTNRTGRVVIEGE